MYDLSLINFIPFQVEVLSQAQRIDREHDIIVVTIRLYMKNGMHGRCEKIILDCELRENYKNKGR